MHCRILMPNPDLLLSLFLSQPSSTTFTLFFSVQPSSINFSFLVSTHYFNFSYLFLSQPSSVYFNCPKPSCIIFTVPNLSCYFFPISTQFYYFHSFILVPNQLYYFHSFSFTVILLLLIFIFVAIQIYYFDWLSQPISVIVVVFSVLSKFFYFHRLSQFRSITFTLWFQSQLSSIWLFISVPIKLCCFHFFSSSTVPLLLIFISVGSSVLLLFSLSQPISITFITQF